MNFFLKLLAPAVLLGAALLLGERSVAPPSEIPSLEMSAASDDLGHGSAPCPGLLPGRFVVSLLPVLLPPSAAARLTVDAPAPEPRSLSPPSAV